MTENWIDEGRNEREREGAEMTTQQDNSDAESCLHSLNVYISALRPTAFVAGCFRRKIMVALIYTSMENGLTGKISYQNCSDIFFLCIAKLFSLQSLDLFSTKVKIL